MKLAAEGRTANEIASALYLSYGTVRNYLSSIMSKLEARTRIEAIENARSKGWL